MGVGDYTLTRIYVLISENCLSAGKGVLILPFCEKNFCMTFYSGGGYFVMPQQVWGQSDLICTPYGAVENWAYPYKNQIWKFWNLGVVTHPEFYFEILRQMVKKLPQFDLPCLSYGKKSIIYLQYFIMLWKLLLFGHKFKLVGQIELIPSP